MYGKCAEPSPTGQLMLHFGLRDPGRRAGVYDPTVQRSVFPPQPAPPTLADKLDVERLAGQSSLKAQTLLEIGRAFDFLFGDEAAGTWFRAALAKAQTEYDKT